MPYTCILFWDFFSGLKMILFYILTLSIFAPRIVHLHRVDLCCQSIYIMFDGWLLSSINSIQYEPKMWPIMCAWFFINFLLFFYQGHLFRQLVLLFRNSNGDIQSATRDALLRLNVSLSLSLYSFTFLSPLMNHINIAWMLYIVSATVFAYLLSL